MPKDIDPEKFVDASFWKTLNIRALKSNLNGVEGILRKVLDDISKAVIYFTSLYLFCSCKKKMNHVCFKIGANDAILARSNCTYRNECKFHQYEFTRKYILSRMKISRFFFQVNDEMVMNELTQNFSKINDLNAEFNQRVF